MSLVLKEKLVRELLRDAKYRPKSITDFALGTLILD